MPAAFIYSQGRPWNRNHSLFSRLQTFEFGAGYGKLKKIVSTYIILGGI